MAPPCPYCHAKVRPSGRFNRDYECERCGRSYNAVSAGPGEPLRLAVPTPLLAQMTCSLSPIPILAVLPLLVVLLLGSGDALILGLACFGGPLAAVVVPVVTFLVLRTRGKPARVQLMVMSIVINGVVLGLSGWLISRAMGSMMM